MVGGAWGEWQGRWGVRCAWGCGSVCACVWNMEGFTAWTLNLQVLRVDVEAVEGADDQQKKLQPVHEQAEQREGVGDVVLLLGHGVQNTKQAVDKRLRVVDIVRVRLGGTAWRERQGQGGGGAGLSRSQRSPCCGDAARRAWIAHVAVAAADARFPCAPCCQCLPRPQRPWTEHWVGCTTTSSYSTLCTHSPCLDSTSVPAMLVIPSCRGESTNQHRTNQMLDHRGETVRATTRDGDLFLQQYC